MDGNRKTDVLIVGAGPKGPTLAAALGLDSNVAARVILSVMPTTSFATAWRCSEISSSKLLDGDDTLICDVKRGRSPFSQYTSYGYAPAHRD
jgi:thioredoxin reductase